MEHLQSSDLIKMHLCCNLERRQQEECYGNTKYDTTPERDYFQKGDSAGDV